MRATPAPIRHQGVLLFGALAAVALLAGAAGVIAHADGFGSIAAVVGVAAAALGSWFDIRRVHGERSLWEARSQARNLRRQLEQLRADTSVHDPAGAATLGRTDDWEIDPVTGLLREQHLPVLLQQVVAGARRKVLPVAVVFWELDALGDAPPRARDQAVTALGAVAWRTLRESDTVFRLGDIAAVAVLVDTAEVGALLAADRVREGLRSSPVGDTLTVSAGIAVYPTHALDAAELVARAGRALESARADGHERDHVAVATSD